MNASKKAYNSLIYKDHNWCWFYGHPDPAITGLLKELTPVGQRLLSPTTLVLYCALERRRRANKGWVSLSLKNLSTELDIPYRTVKSSFKRLRDLELVEAKYTKNRREDVDFKNNTTNAYWDTQIEYKVLGTYYVSKCKLYLYLPEDKLLKWANKELDKWNSLFKRHGTLVEDFTTDGNILFFGKKYYTKGKTFFNSPGSKSRASWAYHNKRLKGNWYIGAKKALFVGPKAKRNTLKISSTYGQKVPLKTKRKYPLLPKIPSFLKKRRNSTACYVPRGLRPRTPNRGLSPPVPRDRSHMSKGTKEAPVSLLSELNSLFENIRRPTWDPKEYKAGLSRLPFMSKTKTENVGPERMSPMIEDHLKIKYMIEDYNAAVLKLYGKKSAFYLPKGALSKKQQKVLDQLKLGADALTEHRIASQSWALWVIEKFKNMDKSYFVKKAPPITMVFSPKTIVKWEGWFEGTNENFSYVKSVWEPHRAEQAQRLKEARLRLKGLDHWLGFAPWYVELRREEIAAGLLDPTMVWPKKASDSYLYFKGKRTLEDMKNE